jgi:acyl-coenzyme A thioesterase 9
MHFQKQNINGNIFGGYIMRESYELAWITVKNFITDDIQLDKIYDIDFINSVEIGDLMKFEAIIVLIEVILTNRVIK